MGTFLVKYNYVIGLLSICCHKRVWLLNLNHQPPIQTVLRYIRIAYTYSVSDPDVPN